MKKRCNKTHRPAGRCVFRSIVWLAVVEGMPSGVLLHSNLISFTDTFRLQNKRTVARSVKKDFWSTEHLLSMRRSSLPGGSLDNCHLRSSYHTSCLLNYVTEADLKPYPKVWNPSHPLNFGGAREEPDESGTIVTHHPCPLHARSVAAARLSRGPSVVVAVVLSRCRAGW